MRTCRFCSATGLSDDAEICPKCHRDLETGERMGTAQSASDTYTNPYSNVGATSFCSHCGSKIFNAAVVCPKCGCTTQRGEAERNARYRSDVADSLQIHEVVISILIPLVGFIWSFILRKDRPSTANGMLAISIVSWIVWLWLSSIWWWL